MTDTKLSEILDKKGTDVFTTEAGEALTTAASRMVQNSVGSLIVLDKGQVRGIITERDCLRQVAMNCDKLSKIRVSDVLTSKVIAVEPDNTVAEAMAIMTEKRCRHLPVVDKKKGLMGLISIGDLVKQAASDHRAEIHYLTEYILGNYPGVEARGKAVSKAISSGAPA